MKKRSLFRKISIVLLIIIAIFTMMFMGLLAIIDNVEGYYLSGSDINYTFQNNVLFNNTNINEYETYNIRNQTSFDGNYPATYTTFDDYNDFITNSYLTDNNELNNYSMLDGHSEVIQLIKEIGVSSNYFSNIFTSSITDGSIEFWTQKNTTIPSQGYTLLIYNSTDKRVAYIYFNGALITYYDGSFHTIYSDFIANIWYHVKIVFYCVNNTFDFYLNNNFIASCDFEKPYNTDIKAIRFSTFSTHEIKFYLDAIGYSFDNYTIGSNLLSTYSTTNIYEVDKWEFKILSENVLNPNGLDNPNTWTDVESTGDTVNINDGQIYMYWTGGYNGIQKTFADTTNKIFNFTFSINYNTALASLVGNTTIKIYSSDSTLISFLNLHHDSIYEHTIEYYDGSELIVLNDEYPFDTTALIVNVYVNYYDGICCFRLSQGNILLKYFVPLIELGKLGLTNVDFVNYELEYEYSGVLNTPLYLDYIGVYANELSLSNERGYLYKEINDDWNLGHHGLLYINQLNDGFNISVCENEYYLENPDYKELLEYNDLLGYIAGKHYFNVYQDGVYDDACIVVYLKNYIYDVYLGWWETRGFNTQIQVSGSTIVDDYVYHTIFLEFNGTSDYYLVNLFHVENNRLYFNLTCIDTSTEYIQGTFDITDVNTANYSLSLSTRLLGTPFMKGIEYVILSYYTGSDTNILCDTPGTKIISQLLNQENLLTEMGFLITDNDNDGCSGTTLYGYINSFRLVYFPNMDYSILSITLIEMIIPLLVIIFPSLGVYVIPKKKEPFILVLGIAFFSIVCYISSLIPLWLFFIICVALFGVFIGERSSGGVDEV